MPTTRIYPKQTHASPDVALPAIVRFLINDHATITGPGWTIVEARSNSNREVPATATDIDSLASAVNWKNGTLSTGDWIVLESADANNTNHFQLFIKYTAATNIEFKLIPLEDFSTGGGDTATPTLPSTSVGAGTGLQGYAVQNASADWSVVADEGMVAIVQDDGNNTNLRIIYIGELDGARTTGTPPDDRAYVIYNRTLDVFFSPTANNQWTRLSPSNDTTVLTAGYNVQMYRGNTSIHGNIDRDNLLGVDSILPIGVYFGDSSHVHFAGLLRNVFTCHSGMGDRGTADGRDFVYFNEVTGQGSWCLVWDGVTDY